ncbi:hypothetical protein Glove_382g33 [Diversispora epigaea]|uniref:Uncharacterized protein n=1 Tax=Diversispora epigaea TaxID=1348612 RepID=A0A397H872_9GLOM|nr:hypothetical protein Glove_382g33 [Diversispora epigaea]
MNHYNHRIIIPDCNQQLFEKNSTFKPSPCSNDLIEGKLEIMLWKTEFMDVPLR